MGQAKIRKKNGTYPTPAEIAVREAERIRKQTVVWYPTADDLPLLHIPEHVRPQLRKRLDPWLRNLTHMGGKTQRVGIKGGECFRIAQALVMTAKDPDVKYVEGFWAQGTGHAWAIVDGYRIDLVGELFSWRDGDNERLYEPFQEFSHEELSTTLKENGYDDATVLHYECEGNPASYSIVHQRWIDEGNIVEMHRCHDFDGPGNLCECKDRSVMCEQWESCDCEYEASLAPAFERLKKRLKEKAA
jgi:hypothetical protein